MAALISGMEQPLGRAVGNILEVWEAVDTLQGHGPPDFQEFVQAVAREMLLLGGESTVDKAQDRVQAAIDSGAALAKFIEFVVAQGGDAACITQSRALSAPVVLDVLAERSGFVSALNAQEIGLTVVGLGGGRQKKGDSIDHRVGVVLGAKVGAEVRAGDLLCTLHAANTDAAHAIARLRAAYSFADEPPPTLPLILERITS